MLTRYGRSQFPDPDKLPEKKPENGENGEKENPDEEIDFLGEYSSGAGAGDVDPDLRILLTAAVPLLKSRNAAVIQAVSTLYYYLAPYGEKHKIAKALVRVIRNTREMQYCVLTTIRAIATTLPEIFHPYLGIFR
jgi:AP-3 complex subunit beta